MKRKTMLEMSQWLMQSSIEPEFICVDATMGNGHDTHFLSSLCHHVYAFDIQEQALKETEKLLTLNRINNVTLIHDSHEHMHKYITDPNYIIFNLGYLPGGDKSITTTVETTLHTLDMLIKTMRKDQIIHLVIYPGHPEGQNESIQIDAYLKQIKDFDLQIVRIDLPYQDHQPPYILWITKK